MDSVIEGLKYIYRCCTLFALEKESQIFAIDDCLIYNSVISGLLVISNNDNCNIFEDDICHCFTCKKLFLLENRPKFGILNGLSRVDCSSCSLALADLSMTKKTAISYTHLVVSMFKLRLSKTFNPATYSDIKGYAVFFSTESISFINPSFFSNSGIAWYHMHYLGRTETLYKSWSPTFYTSEKTDPPYCTDLVTD